MEASELRIGNYYEHDGEVKQVTPNTILDVWESKRSWCNPIPLTEEWFIGFGFRKVHGSTYTHYTKGFFNWYGVGSYISVEFDNGISNYDLNTDCEYVHQLQNLYYVLESEELTYTKP